MKNDIYKNNMEDYVVDDIRLASMALMVVGLPTNNPKRRVFFEDVDSCQRFTTLFYMMAGMGQLSQDSTDKVLKEIKENGQTYGLHKLLFTESEDDSYKGYPQFKNKTSNKEVDMQLSFNFA